MNAYELADELQELDSKLHLINLFKSANMLRQQADRIAELEQEKIRAYDNGFEDGQKANTQLHPLSDDEIREIFEKNWLDLKDYKEFARLILKKASEK
jgi:hypothetical protein